MSLQLYSTSKDVDGTTSLEFRDIFIRESDVEHDVVVLRRTLGCLLQGTPGYDDFSQDAIGDADDWDCRDVCDDWDEKHVPTSRCVIPESPLELSG
jgi:hypothetical protein